MPKETLIAIGAGVLSAISATAFLIQAPAVLIFVYLASLPLFMAGLALGPRAVTVAGAIGFMIVGLLGGAISAGVFGMMQAIPALLVVKQMLLQRAPLGTPEGSPDSDSRVEWYSPGDMLCWLTALAAAIFLLAAMAVMATVVEEQSLSVVVAENLDRVLREIVPNMDADGRVRTVAIMAPLFPGAVGVSWLVPTPACNCPIGCRGRWSVRRHWHCWDRVK